MGNISYLPAKKLTPWRKLSLASWKPKGDSSIYIMEDVVMDDVLTYCKQHSLNVYSVLIQAISLAIQDEPQINSTVIRHKILPRKDISVFFHVVNKSDGDDLSGIRVTSPQLMPLKELNTEFEEKVTEASKGEGPYVASKKVVQITPGFLVKPVLNLYAWFAYKWNVNLGVFKSPEDAFGSVMMTAVGSLGITKALCPIAPYTHVPMVISVGRIEPRTIVENNEVVIRNVVTFGFTFDHRIMEGIHFKALFKAFKKHLDQLTKEK